MADKQPDTGFGAWWNFVTGSGGADDNVCVESDVNATVTAASGYAAPVAMTGTDYDPKDVIKVPKTVFSDWDPQTLWRLVLGPLKDNGAGVTAARNHWKLLTGAIRGAAAPAGGRPVTGLLADLAKLVRPVIGPESGWVGNAPTRFTEAIFGLVTYADDLAHRAYRISPDASMGSVAEAVADEMNIVWDRLAANDFTNNGQPWADTATKESKRFYALDPPGSGWATWADRQKLKIYASTWFFGASFGQQTILTGWQWEQVQAGNASIDIHPEDADNVKKFGELMTSAKVGFLTRGQTALFKAAADHLQAVYTTSHPFVPVPPPAKDPLAKGSNGTGSQGVGAIPPVPRFDPAAILPTAGSALPDLDTGGLAQGGYTGGIGPYAATLTGPPDGVVAGGLPGPDMLTTPADFTPTTLGPLPDALNALSPGLAAGAFGPGVVGPVGTMFPGSVGIGGGLGAVSALPPGIVGTPGVSGVGAQRGFGAREPLVAGRGPAGVVGPAGSMGGMPYAPMHPGLAGEGEQEAEGSENNLVEDRLFTIETECVEPVVGEHTGPGGQHARPGDGTNAGVKQVRI